MPFSLADAIFWVAVACCTVAQLAILRSVLVTRPATETRAHRVVEIAWAVLPGVALAWLLLATWRVMHPALGGVLA
jgi:hypothetical protein